ncbi:unnamed protein product [Tenebrio molitor]|nr:unnamed protein product [Tenebrio molitor]
MCSLRKFRSCNNGLSQCLSSRFDVRDFLSCLKVDSRWDLFIGG